MWLSAITVTPPAAEPLSEEDVRDYLRIDTIDFNTQIADWIVGARTQVEKMTGTRLITQTVKLQAGSFCDLERLPVGPIASIAGLSYQDSTGQTQQLGASSFELFGGGVEWGLRLAAGARWPLVRAVEGAIAITAVVGYGYDETAIPGNVRIALLQLVRGLWLGQPVDVSDWLVNDRIWL